jgi:hypothetical protein
MCGAKPCQLSPFFQPAVQRATAGAPFFSGPMLQRQESTDEEEKKDPLTEGLKTTAGQLAKHKPFKAWYEPKLELLKYTLWEKASPEEKAAMISFLGLNLGIGGAAFATNPELRAALSGVNIGAPLGWIPYSPIEGFKYTLPEPGKSSAYGFSGDFTLTPYLEAIRKKHPGMPLTGATFGLDTAYDPTGKGFSVTGGKFGLDFFGGALKAEGKTFKDLSPYPMFVPGTEPGAPGSMLMQQVPGLPQIGGPGFQFTVNADLLKLFPGLQKVF